MGTVAGMAVTVGLASSAPAATLTVTSERDRGAGSLRNTIERADDGDTVRLPPGTYRVTRGALEIEDSLTIRGAGAKRTVVDARRRSRVMEALGTDDSLRLKKLTVTGGRVEGSGAGIFTLGDLTLDRVTVRGNRVATGDFARFGAGIAHGNGDLTLNRSVITRNVVVGGTGQNFGAGVSMVVDGGDLRVLSSTVSNNAVTGTSGSGGGLFMSAIPTADPANMLIRRSTFAGNSAPTAGGALVYQQTDTSGLLTTARIVDSTISGNQAAGDSQGFGGGIYLSNVLTDDAALLDVSVANTTVSGNVAGTPEALGRGGGIAFETVTLGASGAALTINNATISGNRAFVTGSGGQGGGINVSGDPPTLSNSIVARNRASGSPDCSAAVPSSGNNLEGATSCGFTSLGDQQDANPMLEPLRANGGPTQTRALKPGSPALNRGSNATCEPRDQRGVIRPQGPRCDVGAYERKR